MLLLYGQFLPLYCKYLLYLFKCSYVGYICIDNCYIFLFEKSFYHCIMSFSVSCKIFQFKINFVWHKYCYFTSLFCFHSMKYLSSSHIIFQSVCVSISEMCLLWQYIYGFCFFTHLATPCLLIAEFSPIIFKVVTDNHLFMLVYCFLIVLQFIFVSFIFAWDLITIFSIMWLS